jgi:hypothetical protein
VTHSCSLNSFGVIKRALLKFVATSAGLGLFYYIEFGLALGGGEGWFVF